MCRLKMIDLNGPYRFLFIFDFWNFVFLEKIAAGSCRKARAYACRVDLDSNCSMPKDLNVKVHYKRHGPGHEWWYMASLKMATATGDRKKCLKLAALPWNRAHSSLSIPKTSMPLVWIGQRRSRQSTERYFSCSWRCSFTSSFTHLWALLLRIAHF